MATEMTVPFSNMSRCQYGVWLPCGALAVTKRQRPSARPDRPHLWDVCQKHADVLDRLRSNIAKHKPVLDALEAAGD